MFPTLFRVGHVAVSSFGVLAATGLILGLVLSLRTARTAGLPSDAVWDAGIFCIVSAFVLSRVLLAAENVRGFLHSPLLLLAVHSLTWVGVLGTAGVTWGWLRLHRLPVLATAAAWAPCATLVWGFLSVGHFAEGSDPGLGRSSVGLYGAAWAWGLTAILLTVLSREPVGETAGLALVGAGLGEFGLGFLRLPDISGLTTLLDVAQWLGIGLMVAGTVLVVLAGVLRARGVRV